MFAKLVRFVKDLAAERSAAIDAVENAALEHGHIHAHLDGTVHSHRHEHGDFDHSHEHEVQVEEPRR